MLDIHAEANAIALVDEATGVPWGSAEMLIHAWTPPGQALPLTAEQIDALVPWLDVEGYRFPKEVVAPLLGTVLYLLKALAPFHVGEVGLALLEPCSDDTRMRVIRPDGVMLLGAKVGDLRAVAKRS